MDRIGVVVNPIAGMGGRVGLKGTDGKVEEARELGAEPRAPGRAREALEALHERRPELSVDAAGGEMGAKPAREAGYDPVVVYEPDREETTAADTRSAVEAFVERGVDLVVFVGGDGTAVDVAEAVGETGTPILGVPAGVKVYSSVFGVTPRDAGRIAASFDAVEEREVNDIDEDAYREGEVRSELRAVVSVPVSRNLQSSKQLGGGSVDALARGVAEEVEAGTTYVFGPGGTVGAIEEELGVEPSPLGVDVWRDGELLVRDGSEAEILAAIEEPAVVVVSPIGGQGFVFGRGNHQISPAVIDRAAGIEIVASERKIEDVGVLRVDTDDEATNDSLRGWVHVRTGRFTTRMMKVV